jgi:hypothetical protein
LLMMRRGRFVVVVVVCVCVCVCALVRARVRVARVCKYACVRNIARVMHLTWRVAAQ